MYLVEVVDYFSNTHDTFKQKRDILMGKSYPDRCVLIFFRKLIFLTYNLYIVIQNNPSFEKYHAVFRNVFYQIIEILVSYFAFKYKYFNKTCFS